MSEIFTAEGVVASVGSKRVGKRVYYNLFLEDDDTMYRTGTEKADVEEGDEVTFDYEDGDYGPMVEMDTLEVVGQAAPQRKKKSKKKKSKVSRGRPARNATSASVTKNMSKDDYWAQKAEDDKQRQNIISLQAAYNTALDMLSKELDMGLVKLGTEKAAAPKKLAAFEALLAEKADELWIKFCSAGNGPAGTKSAPKSSDVEDDDIDDSNEYDEENDDDFDD